MKAPPIIKGSEKYATRREILYEKKTKYNEMVLFREPDGRVHLIAIYYNFAQPVSRDFPCEHIGNGKYKCGTVIIDTQEKTFNPDFSYKDVLKESPILSGAGSFLTSTAKNMIVIGIITGLSVYILTKLIDNTLKGLKFDFR
ncbi:MAG: hypothetical protein GXO22_07290 [Aquificae bacterium]|nr:hypothetical protein [Aquificota bacterium]